jgi:hypothetical protein
MSQVGGGLLLQSLLFEIIALLWFTTSSRFSISEPVRIDFLIDYLNIVCGSES